MKKITLILSAALMLSACGSTETISIAQVEAPIPQGESRIIVERDNSLLYMAGSVTVEANGQKIASLGRGGSVAHDVRAGANTLKVSTPTSFGQFVLHFDAEPQEVYNFAVSPKVDALFVGAAFGMAGDAINANVSEQSGYFQIDLKDVE